jgi:hypothetical protein
MSYRRLPRLIGWFFIAVFVLAVLLSFPGTIRWDGSWDQEEYRFTFLDRTGKPVEGVRLQVENNSGDPFYFFPVADYLPDHVPSSGDDGVLVFHHIPHNMVSGTERMLFGVFPLEQSGPPVYVCRFLHHGQEVNHARYNDIVNQGRKTVKRRWKWLTWPELQKQVFQDVDLADIESARLRIFDRNGNGKLDRDEVYAANAADLAMEKVGDIFRGSRPEWEEVEFRLVERTVILDLP